MRSTLLLILSLVGLTCHATMTDEWRSAQLAPKPDPAREPAVTRPAPVHELPVVSARDELLDAPVALGFTIAPFEYVQPWPQNYTGWLEPAVTNFLNWPITNRWAFQWTSNFVDWNTAALVRGTNRVTVTVTANPIYWRAKFQ